MKMRRIVGLFAVLFALGFSSCEDALDIKQDGNLDNDATFRTINELRQYLAGSVYTSLSVQNEIGFTAVFTDEVSIGVNNGGQEKELHRFVLNPSDAYANTIWLQHYTTINRVNRLIQASELIDREEGDEDEFNSIIAQARAIRAYAYLQLLTFYSTDMADDNALGVILSDEVPEIGSALPRSTNGEIYALMEGDLAYAADNLGDPALIFQGSWPSIASTPWKFVSANLINAINARMYLYRKNYTLARQYAQAVVDSGLTLTGTTAVTTPAQINQFYSANSPNPYRRMWQDLAQGEIIFSLSRPISGTWGNVAGLFYFNATSASGGAFLEMGRNLFNELEEVESDVRRFAFVDRLTMVVDNDYLTNPNYISDDIIPIDKYPGKLPAALRNDLKVFRLSEMYFILAECAIADGDLGTAATLIKAVRDARDWADTSPLPVYADATAAYGDLLDERRKELCFEAFRYIDLKRLGNLGNRAIDRNPTDDDILGLPLTLPNNDHRFTLPIPQSEIAGNPAIANQQNPQY